MSLASHLYRGYIENGRRYQTLREGAYWGPCDDKQFESMAATHVQMAIMDSEEENPLFRSPLPFTRPGYKPPTNGDPAGYILDIGTGEGAWAMDVAELFPEVQVIGVDLYPPPPELVPQNCIFEVDDITMDWTWKHKFDLVHIRWMIAAFTEEEWVGLYQHAYE